MSQYLNIFLQHKDNEPVLLWSFSRSSQLYCYSDAPYGVVEKLTVKTLHNVRDNLKNKIEFLNHNIQHGKDMIADIQGMANADTFEDCVDQIVEYRNGLATHLQEQKEIEHFLILLSYIEDIFSSYEDNIEMYWGIEATKEDILKVTNSLA